MHAIETEYAGYRFRSRLEARWAVFFDTAGIDFQYEPEGFEFDGNRYLPDFWLPDLELWAEVKGQWRSAGDWDRFLRGVRAIAEPGAPGFLLLSDTFRQPRGGFLAPWRIIYNGNGKLSKHGWWSSLMDPHGPQHRPGCCTNTWWQGEPIEPDDDARVLAGFGGYGFSLAPWFHEASRAAQQARFEFGETPGRGAW